MGGAFRFRRPSFPQERILLPGNNLRSCDLQRSEHSLEVLKDPDAA